jgi:hypothetical protein
MPVIFIIADLHNTFNQFFLLKTATEHFFRLPSFYNILIYL